MFGSKKSALDNGRESVAQAADDVGNKASKAADKAGEKVKDFDTAKTAETAATVFTELKNRAASTLEKAGLGAAMGTAATKAAGAAEGADLSGKAAVAGERAATTATWVRDWVVEMLSVLTSKSGDVAAEVPPAAEEARSRVSSILDTLLGTLQRRAAEVQEQAMETGDKASAVRVDPETLAQLGRALVMIGTVLSGLFGPRSGDAMKGMREAAREASEAGKERADDLASVGKDLLTTLAAALIAAIQRAEERGKQAIDEGREQVVGAGDTADAALESAQEAASAEEVEVVVEKKKGVHFFRWLFLGLMIGGGYAYYQSRKGDDDGWESMASGGSAGTQGSYWPSAPTTESQPAESSAPSAMASDTPAMPADTSTMASEETKADS